MSKSSIFTAYNQGKAVARRSPKVVDMSRLNRALGIAMSVKAQAEDAAYHATETHCDCPDWTYRLSARRNYTGPCKHMIAARLMREEVEVA